jgi:hypothetical protein
MIIPFQKEIVVGAAAFAIGVLSSAYFVSGYLNTKFEAKMQEEQNHALVLLQEQTERTRETEQNLNLIKSQLEIENNEKNIELETLLGKYNSAVSSGKRLRDPGQTNKCKVSRDSPNSSDNNRSDTGGELSIEANRFLLSESARADYVLGQLKLCSGWVETLRAQIKEHNLKTNPFIE